ncbi:MAG: N-carbamoylputrescine amidase [Nitrospirota bacterium]|nr:N-carbamoylputrescine amidase [Nitrospirota bacterium]
MRIAGIQTGASHDVDRNITHAVELAEIAAEKGAKSICFSELCLTPWFLRHEDKKYLELARERSSGILDPFLASSLKTKTVIVLPFFERYDGRFFSSAAVMDCGVLKGVYRKVHIPDLPLYKERFYLSSGDGDFPVFETSHGRIGVQLCWDNLFPEGTRILALKGADLVFAPTAASQDTHAHWERAISANAFANNLTVFRVNRVGTEDGLVFYGRSFCAGPWGDMVSELAGSKEAIVMAEVDPRERDTARETWGFLNHRQPSAYRDIINDRPGPGASREQKN